MHVEPRADVPLAQDFVHPRLAADHVLADDPREVRRRRVHPDEVLEKSNRLVAKRVDAGEDPRRRCHTASSLPLASERFVASETLSAASACSPVPRSTGRPASRQSTK